MITVAYVQTMARYNAWMNDKIYAACERLDDAERNADRGAFFGSVHATLNHLLWGDRAWLGRFTKGMPNAKAYPQTAMGSILFADWSELKAARFALDADIVEWAAGLRQDWLDGDFSWYSGVKKATLTKPVGVVVAHLFNHQTHHRGQVTTLLAQRGVDPGDTDLALMPETVYPERTSSAGLTEPR
jgi:uncharacterized damage-inducible protein DinB